MARDKDEEHDYGGVRAAVLRDDEQHECDRRDREQDEREPDEAPLLDRERADA